MTNDTKLLLMTARKHLQKAAGVIDAANDQITGIRESEQGAYHRMPPAIQMSEYGDMAAIGIEKLIEAVTEITECLDKLERADGLLEEAMTL